MISNFNLKGLLTELELQIEIEELRRIGLSEEEIEGYFDFYVDSWIVSLDNQKKMELN